MIICYFFALNRHQLLIREMAWNNRQEMHMASFVGEEIGTHWKIKLYNVIHGHKLRAILLHLQDVTNISTQAYFS